jgi:hypothetical protein
MHLHEFTIRHPKYRVIAILVVITVVVFWAGSFHAAALEPTATTITLYRPNTEIHGCETVDVEIWINDVTDLYGADVRLSFDPNVVEVVDADPNTAGVQIADGDLLGNIFTAKNEVDNSAGTIFYAVTQLNPQPPANGSGLLAVISFRAKSVGASDLDFTYTKLANRDGEELPATSSNGDITTYAPSGVTDVSISMPDATTARLSWSAVTGAETYNIYRDSAPYFSPTPPPYATVLPPDTTYDDNGAVGDWTENHYYVMTVSCSSSMEGDISNRVGEFDFELIPGTP